MKDLGDRMKDYEAMETHRKLMPRLPVYVRLDGRSFSKFTKNMHRPFDQRMIDAMIETTKYLVSETGACIGYTQSDEISLVLDGEKHVFFEGSKFKLTSVLSSVTASTFLLNYIRLFGVDIDELHPNTLPAFDCRVINLPSKTEASNMILWRELDATRNAITSAVRTVISHKQLQNKNTSEMQEILFKNGINFNDYPTSFKRGTFVRTETILMEMDKETYDKIPNHKKPVSMKIHRNVVDTVDMPVFLKVINRDEVIFDNACAVTDDAN